jgi:hypothetical protein
MADKLSKAEWLQRFKKQRKKAESDMREAGMTEEQIYAWRRRTGKSLEDKGKVPKPKAAKSKPAYKKTLEEQEKRRGALGRLVSKKRKK